LKISFAVAFFQKVFNILKTLPHFPTIVLWTSARVAQTLYEYFIFFLCFHFCDFIWYHPIL